MNKKWIKVAVERIWEKTRIEMHAIVDTRSRREGAAFWFSTYSRSNGPVFSIHPYGLKRHSISMMFGNYASACIQHIREHANIETYVLANALIGEVGRRVTVECTGMDGGFSASLSERTSIVATRRIDDARALTSWVESVDVALIPMIAALAELIGYDNPHVDADAETETQEVAEGRVYQALVQKRERNPKSRLLCLMMHGNHCGVCGVVPQERYGDVAGTILEVHHIEPLSELEAPKVFDPRNDLIPLCPNCHRAIHTRKPAYRPEELRKLIR